MQQHEGTDQHIKMRYNLDKEAMIDRRKMIYMGIPTPNTMLANEMIQFKRETQLWHCTK